MRDFFLINSIVRNDKCWEYFDSLRNDVLSYEDYIVSKNVESLIVKRHIYGYLLLKHFPHIYKQSILIRKKLRGY